MKQKVAIEIISLLLILLFVYAASSKLIDYNAFKEHRQPVTGYCAGNRCFAKSNMRRKHQKALPVSLTGMVLRIFGLLFRVSFLFGILGFKITKPCAF